MAAFLTPTSYQSISTLGQNMRVRESIADLRTRILEAQDQLASKKKASTHGGLGSKANLVQGMRAKVSMLTNYMRTAEQIGTRLDAAQLSLDIVQKEADRLSSKTLAALNTDTKSQLAKVPMEADGALQSMITALNASIEGRSLFAGDDTHVRPVIDKTRMLDGEGGRLGLRGVIDLRAQADGITGTGRVASTVLAGPPDGVRLESSGGVFGMRPTKVTTSSTDVTVPATPLPANVAGTGVTADITLTGPMADGDSLNVTFRLPDGSEKTVTMVATSTSRTADETALANATGTFFFQLGGTAADTATSLDSGLEQAMGYMAKRDLAGASAVAAGKDFFTNNQPRIPDGLTAATATDYRIDSARVFDWYGGDENRQTVAGVTDIPPAAPAVGDTYAVANAPPAATLAFAGREGQIATWNGNYWEFTRPEAGTEVVDTSTGELRLSTGGAPPTWSAGTPAPVEQTARDSVRAKIDDGTWVSYGLRADEAAFRDALMHTALLTATPYDAADDSRYRAMAERSSLQLGEARDRTIDTRSRLGVTQARVKTTFDLHEDVNYLTKEQINRIENIDEYDVAVSLNDMMTQLQASYQVTARLQQLNLASFL